MANPMCQRNRVGFAYPSRWVKVCTPDDTLALCPSLQDLRVLDDPKLFWARHREAHLGPVTMVDVTYGSDTRQDWGDHRTAYFINLPVTGRHETLHRGSSFTVSPGTAAIFQPQGGLTLRRRTRGRTIAVRLDRCAVDDSLSDALGYQLTSHIEFEPTMPTTNGAASSWTNLVHAFHEQLLRPDSVLNNPMVAMPFVESLVRGLLVAAAHPHRAALAAEVSRPGPRSIRSAIDTIEADAHLPLTVAAIAARSHISVRALQKGFRRHLGVSPMAYLREVRLRHAHQALLDADPSIETVAAVANRWGSPTSGVSVRPHHPLRRSARGDSAPDGSVTRYEATNTTALN
jgi:AraC-like DNA-binding protein